MHITISKHSDNSRDLAFQLTIRRFFLIMKCKSVNLKHSNNNCPVLNPYNPPRRF